MKLYRHYVRAVSNSLFYNIGDTCICGVSGCCRYPPPDGDERPDDEEEVENPQAEPR
jgi:hypothetical protein